MTGQKWSRLIPHGWVVAIVAMMAMTAMGVSRGDELERGYELLNQGEYESAKRVAVATLQKQEQLLGAYSLLALSSYNDGEPLDAIIAAEAALLLDTQNPHLMILLVSCYQRLAEMYKEPKWHERAMQVADAASRIESPFQILALEFIVQHENAEPSFVVKPEPPLEIYQPILQQINRAWVEAENPQAPVNAREVALLADPVFIDHRRVARGRLPSGGEVRFYPTYPPREKYFAVIENLLGHPERVEQPEGSPYKYNFFGRVIVVSDARQNVYGLAQRQ